MSVKVLKICRIELENPHKINPEFIEYINEKYGLVYYIANDNYTLAKREICDFLEKKIQEVLDDV